MNQLTDSEWKLKDFYDACALIKSTPTETKLKMFTILALLPFNLKTMWLMLLIGANL